MAYKLNGKTLQADRGFTHDGVQYPRNWLVKSSQGDRDALGIIWEADPVRADDRYYWNGDVNNPKALDDVNEVDEDDNPLYESDGVTPVVTKGLKSNMTAQVKDTAGKMLASTDWYVVRNSEKSTAIPADVTTKRDAIRTECDRLETAIAGAADVDALMTVMNSQDWPE